MSTIALTLAPAALLYGWSTLTLNGNYRTERPATVGDRLTSWACTAACGVGLLLTFGEPGAVAGMTTLALTYLGVRSLYRVSVAPMRITRLGRLPKMGLEMWQPLICTGLLLLAAVLGYMHLGMLVALGGIVFWGLSFHTASRGTEAQQTIAPLIEALSAVTGESREWLWRSKVLSDGSIWVPASANTTLARSPQKLAEAVSIALPEWELASSASVTRNGLHLTPLSDETITRREALARSGGLDSGETIDDLNDF
ncbi:hypothetical protein [Luteococcus peritonei]|uniref:Uncharacterized protein n=1 Tax=Luteococcus peritonei TaxID=88874 RepID=A0ABW4RVS9_9ACTN